MAQELGVLASLPPPDVVGHPRRRASLLVSPPPEIEADHDAKKKESQQMSATLTLTRQGAGIELRRGLFEIELDGKRVGSIKYHDTVELPVEPGHHTLRIRSGRYSSGEHSFDAADGEGVTFRTHGAMVWPRYVASIVKPDLAISLRRE
ncbi:MAG TPA: hypothetical protein VG186_14835 [Solirubrobacteraceae bacterium]|nr:hypothetical protein [Solirubrobacteraceae bacterium]